MTIPTVRIAILGFIICLVSSTAEAAKGVKKATLGKDQYIVSGIVTTMSADGNGGGFIQVRTTVQQKQPKSPSATGTPVNSTGQNPNKVTKTYHPVIVHVNEATQFANQNGDVLSGAGLVVGTNVRILAQGDQALNVQVLSQNSLAARFMRSRARRYIPHVNINLQHPIQ